MAHKPSVAIPSDRSTRWRPIAVASQGGRDGLRVIDGVGLAAAGSAHGDDAHPRVPFYIDAHRAAARRYPGARVGGCGENVESAGQLQL